MAGLSGTACCNPVRSPLTRSCPSAVLILRNPLCSFSADLCYPPLSVGAGRINNLVCSAMNKRAGGHIIHAMGAEASPTMPHAAKTSASEGDGKAPPSISEYRNDIRSISLSLSITDALPSRACLGNAMYHQSARKGEEMPGLETQISYSHETVMAFKPELSLRLSRLHSISKNRSSRSRMNPMAVSHEMHKNGRDLAGTASLGFGRKKDGVTLTRGKSDPLLHKYGERQLKQDADDMFDKTPQRICSPNRGSLSVSAQTECDKKEYGSQQKPEMSKPFQILIAHLSGKSILQWVRATDLVQELKLLMEKRTGIPSMYQRLLYEGKQLEDNYPLSWYNIQRNVSITLSMRLRGGAIGQPSSASAAAFSYKDAVHSKKPKEKASPAPAPKPFLVDKAEDIPSIEVAHPILDRHYQSFAESGIICRFNGLWPSTIDLHHWINANWTDNCRILLCSKGFFITLFFDSDDYQRVLTKGPWFWNSAGLFLTPWFPEFDPSTAVITKLPIWVRLPNLPVHLWSSVVFEAIGNSLGRYIETDQSRALQGMYTYARICAEIDISKGLPDQINLKVGDFHWSQPLDYENTAFRCRYCHLTGHLQSSCPSMPLKKKKAKSKPKDKSWTPQKPPSFGDIFACSSSEEDEEEDVAVVEEMTEQVSPAGRHAEASVTPSAQKRSHESSPSDSDKELSPPVQNSLQIVLDQLGPNGWVTVGKKKGKKSRPSVPALGG